MKTPERKAVDDETKRDVTNKILSGDMTIDEARKQLNAQSYQVAAWVGLEADARIQKGYRLVMRGTNSVLDTTSETGTMPSLGSAARLSKLTPQQRAIVELYVNDLMSAGQ